MKMRRYTLILAMTVCSALTALAADVVKVESVSVKVGENVVIPILLENSDNVSSLQLDITMPKGISYVDGSVALNSKRADISLFDIMLTDVSSKYTDEQKVQFSAENVWRLLVLSKDGSAIKENSGEIASITIKVAENFLTHSELNVVKVIGSYEAKKIAFADCVDIQVISLDLINEDAYTRLSDVVSEVQESLNAAKSTIETDCKDVATDFTATITDIQKSIDDLKAELDAKYKNVELTAESTIDTSAITASIEKLKTDAVAAQKAYEEQKAEEAKKQANEEAYTKLSAQITEVQNALNAAKTTVETDCKDVAANFTATITDIQKEIDDLKSELDMKYKNVELTAESTIETSDILDSIDKLIVDATNAQEEFEESQIISGDANSDGRVNIADANMVVNYFLGKIMDTSEFNSKAADTNADGKIDIADANMIVNIFLKKI